MSELRRNPLTGEWVIVAPERGRRPHRVGEARIKAPGPARRPERDGDCPFCPGNEGMLPGIAAQLPPAAELPPGADGWQVRVVPNKFPAVEPVDTGGGAGKLSESVSEPGSPGRAALEETLPGRGRHEVIVEGPRHDLDLTSLPEETVVAVLEAYRWRLLAARELPGVRHVVVFRNHGEEAGTSLLHPHSQLVALPVVPEAAARRKQQARAHYSATGRCLLCRLVERERTLGRRLVFAGAGFAALVPFAAGVPCETWIVPWRHGPDFAATSAEELRQLASCLRRVLRALKAGLGDPDYNYVLHTFAAEADPALHWLLRIRPRTVTPAGFEVGSGISINPSSPEEDAALLRSNLEES